MTESEAEKRIEQLLTAEFLTTLTEIAKLYGWNGDYCEIGGFVEQLHMAKRLPIPDLEPYNLETN